MTGEKQKKPNTQLRRERELKGWSQQALAGMLGTSEQVVSRWESGEHKPNRYFQTQLCQLFGKNAEELGFMDNHNEGKQYQQAQERKESLQVIHPQREQALMKKPPDYLSTELTRTQEPNDARQADFPQSYPGFLQGEKQDIVDPMYGPVGDDMDILRRQLLQSLLSIGGVAVTSNNVFDRSESSGALRNVFLSNSSSFVLYDYLLSLSWELYYAGSSQSLTHIVDYCLYSLIAAVKETHNSEQRQLLTLLCRFYQLSGVLAKDRMDITRALSDGKKAIELAFNTENVEMIAASLFRRAKTYMRQNEYDKAIQDLDVALLYANHSRDPLKGYIHQATADVYSFIAVQDMQVQKKCLSLLDNVEDILVHGNLEDDGSFVKVNRAGLSIDRAGILTRFQKPQEARQILATAQQHLGSELTRWQSRLFIADAETYFMERDPQSCCTLLFEALRMVRATRSRSNEARITTLYRQLETFYPHHVFVLQLGEQLRAQ